MTTPGQEEKRPLISVAMIVRDGADRLPQTLESVRDLADEIVVMDCSSNDAMADATAEIAQSHGASLHAMPWQDDYSAARNECLQHITGQWVLWLEAGETIERDGALQLGDFIDQFAEKEKLYLLQIERPAIDSPSSCEQIGELRVMPNRPELQFVGRMREQVLPSVVAAGLEVDALQCTIRQPEMSLEQRAQSAEENLRLANLILEQEGEQPAILAARAEALASLGDGKEAVQAYRRVLEIAEEGTSIMLEAYYGLLTAMDTQDPSGFEYPSDSNGNLLELQIATCLEALDIYPLDAQLLCGVGSYLLRADRLDLAARSYELALSHGQIDPSTWHLPDLIDIGAACLSLIHQVSGNADQAEKVLGEALATRPQSLRLQIQQIELYIKQQREEEALEACDQLPSDLPNRDQIRESVQGALLFVAGKRVEAIRLLASVFSAGGRNTLCLRYLTSAYLTEENWKEAEMVLAEWELLERANLEMSTFQKALAERRESGTTSEEDGPKHRVDEPGNMPHAVGVPNQVMTASDRPPASV